MMRPTASSRLSAPFACCLCLVLVPAGPAARAQGTGSPAVVLSYPAVSPKFGGLLQQAIASGRSGALALRNNLPADILKALQVVDRLDLSRAEHRLVLGAMAQHVPQGFDDQLAAYISEISPEDGRGAYSGLFTMTMNLSFLFGPWAGIMVLSRWGAATLWLGVCAAGLFSSLLYLRIEDEEELLK